MIVTAQVTVNAPVAKLWDTMTNIQRTAEFISGIKNISIIEHPKTGLVGLKWSETRIFFGDTATVEKCITQAKDSEFYTTRAEDSGFVFLTTNRISITDTGLTLIGIHETLPQTIPARFKALPLIFFKGTIRKAILQDLNDIKSETERL